MHHSLYHFDNLRCVSRDLESLCLGSLCHQGFGLTLVTSGYICLRLQPPGKGLRVALTSSLPPHTTLSRPYPEAVYLICTHGSVLYMHHCQILYLELTQFPDINTRLKLSNESSVQISTALVASPPPGDNIFWTWNVLFWQFLYFFPSLLFVILVNFVQVFFSLSYISCNK